MKKDKILLIISILFILSGLSIFFYPNVSSYFAKKNQVEIIREYDQLVVQIDENKLDDEWEKATTYNENLSGEPVHDPFVAGSGYALPDNYLDVLNISKDGVMAYVEIPKISLYLPIYHGTSNEVLEKGIGHIQNTSVPVGGESTLSVLTGHTGLPSAELFTKLDELIVGDVFYIHVLNDVLTYKVYEIKVILPDKIDELQIISGKDIVTLVTCTPYGINSHRLLVKAERVEYEEYIQEDIEEIEDTQDTSETLENQLEEQRKQYYIKGTGIGIIILFLIVIIILFYLKIKKKRMSKKNINDKVKINNEKEDINKNT